MDYESILSMLKFIYIVEKPDKDPVKLVKLFEMADKYCFEPLKKYCELQLCLMINPDIAIDILILAYKLNSTILENKAIEYLTSNLKGIPSIKETILKLINYPNLMLKIAKYK